MTNLKNKLSTRRGFTLIELLIVIAILGVLAVVVLLALNPVQQLARTRDAGRISTVAQIGHALEAYGAVNNGTYVGEAATWITSLVTAGEIASAPSMPAYSVSGSGACATDSVQNSFCYDATTAGGGSPVVVYARLESATHNSKCAAGEVAYAAYSTQDGRGGVVCATAAAGLNPGAQTFLP
jgi:type IV pilus assembly protein PilA